MFVFIGDYKKELIFINLLLWSHKCNQLCL